MMRSFLVIVAAVCLLAGCNTVQGFGKDMQKAGQSVENAAKR